MAVTINASNNTGLVVTPDNTSAIQFQSNGTAAMTIANTRYVGIGTTTPGYQLQVNGTTYTNDLALPNNRWVYCSNTTGGLRDSFGYYTDNCLYVTAVDGSLYLRSGGYNTRMTLDTNGNVGIGTTSPITGLHLDGSKAVLRLTSNTLNPTIQMGKTNAFAIIYDGTNDLLAVNRDAPLGTGISTPLTISNTGVVTLTGGGGSTQLALKNGGDLTIYNSDNTYAAAIWCDPSVTGMDGGAYIFVDRLNNHSQRVGYDRLWENYPSFSVRNDTSNGPQGEIRFHGINGISGGDFGVNLRVDGVFITGSDARRKTNIESIKNALDTVTRLDGKKFNIINRLGEMDPMRGDRKQFGFIAQECLDVIPEMVTFYSESDTPNENGWASAYSIEYDKITALLVNAVKELKIIVENQGIEIANLKSKVT